MRDFVGKNWKSFAIKSSYNVCYVHIDLVVCRISLISVEKLPILSFRTLNGVYPFMFLN